MVFTKEVLMKVKSGLVEGCEKCTDRKVGKKGELMYLKHYCGTYFQFSYFSRNLHFQWYE